ncbi:hypothetical protein KL942_002065 [Ogataea angusta]|uniref:Uncharacterized protein n=1 Tax=Pichia angusta TaxID=870730 RepID=A0ABQ7RRJ6_PICAN|nr:hypothetical protein KL920_002657 [Ogataea angusta]KAG7841077.1 hypothetical protein KL942_002065 [Ogataea angusta]KAG7846151.1 hypothetical protein KL940_004738 [Ogataea angusta]KAG7847117.1 hypothetical protein KL941_002910 [Ogataea angusta]KAG7860961.1 hypothetical protein KL939_001528 [Ogataea angusta]
MRGRTERKPLGAKDTNIHGVSRSTSPYKHNSSKSRSGSLSPVRLDKSSPSKFDSSESLASGLIRLSPGKRPSGGLSSPTKKHRAHKEFLIYEDHTNYRDALDSLESMTVTNVENKENENPRSNMCQDIENRSPQRLSKKRSALADLRIHQYPGYIQTFETNEAGRSGILAPKHQLTQGFMMNTTDVSTSTKRTAVPSFVTPPKKNRIHYKYIQSLNKVDQARSVRSRTDIDVHEVRKLTFDLHDDSIARYQDAQKKNIF